VPDQLDDEIKHQQNLCKAAGCIDGLVTKEELKTMLKPSLVMEIFKILLSVGVPLIYFYGNFRALETRVDMILKIIK
jgi:hypothetical protein